jgi:hypothetical protein
MRSKVAAEEVLVASAGKDRKRQEALMAQLGWVMWRYYLSLGYYLSWRRLFRRSVGALRIGVLDER